ncbi:hypothetical protein FNV43_RR18142 [Rhamnella rubrinervis]|uniref:Diacylglycerol O-acyltransferase n=1 Tax=Rhamnella rubrinervis TaxID=2594499 RepID=A0A8K0E5R9_9ROSA|nr:hypothetical protein FNV43_RR18142 [Rhamnella rubrinervis]
MELEEDMRLRKIGLRPIETKRQENKAIHNSNYDKEINEEEPLSPSARLFHEPNFNVHIIAIIGCGGQKRRRDEMGKDRGGFRQDVIVPKVEQVEVGSPDQFVEDYIFNLSKTSVDESRPLWDLHLLNVKTSQSEAVGVFRIHHSLGDGASLMALLLACTRRCSDPEALPTVPTMKKRHRKTSGSGFWRCLIRVWWAFQLLWNTIVDVFMFMATTLFLKDSNTPLKGPHGIEHTPRRFVFRTISLDDMKLIKNAMDMTVNDVALGITQAGLSQYLNRRYGENKNIDDKGGFTRQKKSINLPKKILLRSLLLINIRPSAGIQALADMMEEKAEVKWGNWIGYVLLPFSIGRDDPLDYIRQAKSTIDRKMHSFEAFYTFFSAEIVLKLFGIKAASSLSHRIITHTAMCFSNLVGPLEEIGFYGHPLAYLAPSSYGQPHALMINFQSYRNKMTIVLSVDEDVIPDAHQLCDDIVHSLHLIKNALIHKGLVAIN